MNDVADGCARSWLVLDIETAPDRHAHVLSRRRGAAPRGSPIHEVVNVSALTLREDAGDFKALDLVSFHRNDYTEKDILANAEAELSCIADAGGGICTFNGRSHDLPTLRRRQIRWWMCEADAIERIQAGEVEHVDLMLAMSGGGEGRWPTLADACASVGFSLLGPYGAGRETRTPRETEKCELDVVGSAILLLYVLAGRRRSMDPLRRGLPALGNFIRTVAMTRPHLERFALSRLLASDADAWGRGEAA